MLKNKYIRAKVIFNVCIIILGTIGMIFLLSGIQKHYSRYKQHMESEQVLAGTISTLESNAKSASELSQIYHNSNAATMQDLEGLLTSGLYDDLATASNKERAAAFADILDRSGAEYLFIMDKNGKIVLAPNADYIGKNVINDTAFLSTESFNALAAGSTAPVHEDNEYGSFYFYSEVLESNPDYIMVLGANCSVLDLEIATLNDVTRVLDGVTVGNDGFLFAVDTTNNTFLCFTKDDSLPGMNALNAGLTPEALQDGYAGTQVINGISYYCVSRTFGTSTVISAATESDSVYANDKYVLFWSLSGLVVVVLLCVFYAVIVRADIAYGKKESRKVHVCRLGKSQLLFHVTIMRKVLPLLLLGVLAVFGISYYTQTLLTLSDAMERSNATLDEAEIRIEQADEANEAIRYYYNNMFLSKAQLLAYLIEEDPIPLNDSADRRIYTEYDETGLKYTLTDDEGNPLTSVRYNEDLKGFCKQNYIDNVYIFDTQGRTIATSTEYWYYVLSTTPGDASYEFRQVLDGQLDELVQEIEDADADDGQGHTVGARLNYYTTTDADGNTLYVSRFDYEKQEEGTWTGNPITAHTSLVELGLDASVEERLLATTQYSYVLSSFDVSDIYLVLFDGTDDHTVMYSPVDSSIGKTAAEIGVSSSAFSGSYNGFQKANGVTYFMCYRYRDGYYIATAISTSDMYTGRLAISLVTGAAALLFVLLVVLTVTLSTEEEEKQLDELAEETSKSSGGAVFTILMPSGRVGTTVKASARWDNKRIPWREKTPEQKLLVMIEIIIGIFIVYMALLFAGAKTVFGSDSIVLFILQGGWDRGTNIFAFSACAAVLIMTALAVSLIRIPIKLFTSLFGTKSETIGDLLISVFKYGGAIAALFYCMYLCGVDTTSLITSASILSLVVGLGAQSLIKDIIAGIFIVFEGEFRVGDIVTIGDFRGQVLDIGLRTTKIMNTANNIKIFNNSDISGVLNMTKESSVASCVIGIEYGQDIKYVESVLNRELPLLKEKLPNMIGDPIYLGISELAASSVNLLIIARCKEQNVPSLGRQLNRELLDIFYRNDINVPFNQVTVSWRDRDGQQVEMPVSTKVDIDKADDPD